jgi:hypothetical protein
MDFSFSCTKARIGEAFRLAFTGRKRREKKEKRRRERGEREVSDVWTTNEGSELEGSAGGSGEEDERNRVRKVHDSYFRKGEGWQ